MAVPAQPDAAGISALAQLPLLPFLAASPGPALVLPLSPLVLALRSRQTATPLKSPVWNVQGQHPAAATGSTGSAKPAIKRFRSNSDAMPTLANSYNHRDEPSPEVLRGIESLNVKTPRSGSTASEPFAGAGTGPTTSSTDYFSLDAVTSGIHPRRPSSAASSEASSADTLLAASPIDGAESPLTPLLEDDESTPGPSTSSSANPFAPAPTAALSPVYRNEAWRNLESAASSATPRDVPFAVPSAVGAAATALGRSGLRRRGKRRRSSHEEEGDALMGAIPPHPGVERAGSGGRSATPLSRVDEVEEHRGMDTDDEGESSGSVSGTDTETENEDFASGANGDDDESGNPYAFLSAEDQATLLSFVLDLVEDRDNGYPGNPSAASSSERLPPTTLSPAPTPSLAADAASPKWTSAAAATAPSPVSSMRTVMPTRRTRVASQVPQTIRLGPADHPHIVSATLVPFSPVLGAPSASMPLDASAASPFGSHASSASGFVILTMAPSAPSSGPLPSHWPPRPSSTTPRSSIAPPHRSPPVATAPSSAPRDVGKAYQSPTTTSETRVGSLSAAAAASAAVASGLTSSAEAQARAFPLGAHEDPWVRALGDSEMGRRIRAHSWHETPLGPISGWQPELKTMVASILASPFRECILWGSRAEDIIIVYNDLYIETAGIKHPSLLGQLCREGWAEIWDGLRSIAERALAGETCFFRDHFLAMERMGFTEETYHTFSYAPFYDNEGNVLGIYNLSIESTATVVAARRLATVRDLVQMTSLARTVEDFSTSALKVFASNPYDLPFVQLFTVEEVTNKPSRKEVRLGYDRSTRTVIKLTNRGSTGIPEDHPFLVQEALVDITQPTSRQSTSSASTSTGTGSTATMLDMRERLEAAAALSPGAVAGSPGPSSASSSTTPSANGARADPRWSWPFEEACLKRDLTLVDDLGPLAESLDRTHGWTYSVRQAVVIPIFVEVGQTIPSAVVVFGINSMSNFTQLMEVFFNLVARHVAIGLFAVLAAEQDRQRAEELIKLDRAKSNFFSSVSHELRTPLTLILGPLDDLLGGSERDKLDRTHRDRLVLVQRHANRLLTMVNKLLDFSSLEGGRMNFKYRPVQIGPLTRDIAILFRDAIERTGIKYEIHCDDDPPHCPPIYLSPDLWDKIVHNVISNAFKYTPSGKITVSLRSTRAEAVLSVTDTGIGIPADSLGRVFDRFHRIEANSRMATGTGIGLALTLELVKLLGGQLEVESELGHGSTFTIRLQRGHTHLPIDQIDHTPEDTQLVAQFQNRNLAVVDEAASWRYDAEAQDAMDATPLSSAGSSDLANGGSEPGNSSGSGSGPDDYMGVDVLSLQNRTIVLVDDSRDLRAYISSLLTKHFTVVAFGDPREALEHIRKSPPSLVLTDAMMPHISGMELTTALRRDPSTTLVPIIMVSAQAGTEARAEALEGGVDDYLVKPFQARELLARVRVHLQLGLLRAELERRVDERTRALIESEAQNRALASRYAMLSTVSPVGVVQIDNQGHPVFCNPRWFEICGMALGRPLVEWTEQIVPDDLQKVDNAWKAATGGEKTEAPERQFRLKNGRWAQLEIRASTEVGLPDGYVGALTDITRQKEIEMLHIREVEQRAVDAEENRRNTEMFLDMSSHELRNPLSGVWQNAEVVSTSLAKYVELIDGLRHGHAAPQRVLDALYDEMLENVEAVESIILCASHQGRIADDILNVSKLNMGLLSINVAPFDLVAAVREVVKTFEVQSHQQQISLVVEKGSSLDDLMVEFIAADAGRIKQVLYNFLTNALKYTLDSLRKRVTVHVEASPGPPVQPASAMRVAAPNPSFLCPDDMVWVVISVQDSGKGLSPEQLKLLFARFSQANPKSDQYGGSGLGLYVSKKLIELHGGFIEVESQLGEGSTFRFAIPASRAQRAASPPGGLGLPKSALLAGGDKGARGAGLPITLPPASPSPTVGPSSAGAGGENEERRRVLIAEDNLVNQRVLMRQLKMSGYDVTVANNGQEALDALMADSLKLSTGGRGADTPIDVVLMDIEMPVMGGLEAIRELRRREAAGEISRRWPVCAVTGNAREAQQNECLAAGFDDVATKPYRLQDVLDKIRRMTGSPTPGPA
ncbi:uncharacterized protein RHOBADRAFT_54600 [Rhodotorula graminis WP1]|uniref:Histidine kinase n=1 Tax=Rhodotorula graminis (strain WP1) TaxID=578459 RepID=A0A0P9EX65_RHOGW|nr:uncharacterized protein RHOBADRAFT_54600 [Rhodotorula graminis WP1]KPV74030.1 hypothetical protein RHOBADRAFT_54600 [Rhodotorula graminis WP1]